MRSGYLDFPEVELSPKDGKLHIQFINPSHLYKNTPALRDLKDDLNYYIEAEEVTFTFLSSHTNSSNKKVVHVTYDIFLVFLSHMIALCEDTTEN